jgi:carbon storage regulator
MLYLTRKIGESIIINNTIELTVVEVRGKTVKLGFLFPKEATILRKELHDKITEQNLAAASAGVDELMDIELDLEVKPQQPQKGEDDDGQGNR